MAQTDIQRDIHIDTDTDTHRQTDTRTSQLIDLTGQEAILVKIAR